MKRLKRHAANFCLKRCEEASQMRGRLHNCKIKNLASNRRNLHACAGVIKSYSEYNETYNSEFTIQPAEYMKDVIAIHFAIYFILRYKSAALLFSNFDRL